MGCAIGGTSQVNPDLNKDILVGTLGRVKQLIKDQRVSAKIVCFYVLG